MAGDGTLKDLICSNREELNSDAYEEDGCADGESTPRFSLMPEIYCIASGLKPERPEEPPPPNPPGAPGMPAELNSLHRPSIKAPSSDSLKIFSNDIVIPLQLVVTQI
ncbi:MAG: hypothetical protein AABY09_05560 [Nanoarchaeota archaeon]